MQAPRTSPTRATTAATVYRCLGSNPRRSNALSRLQTECSRMRGGSGSTQNNRRYVQPPDVGGSASSSCLFGVLSV